MSNQELLEMFFRTLLKEMGLAVLQYLGNKGESSNKEEKKETAGEKEIERRDDAKATKQKIGHRPEDRYNLSEVC